MNDDDDEHIARKRECRCGNVFVIDVSVIKPAATAASATVARARLKRKALLPKKIDHTAPPKCPECQPPLDISWVLDPNKYAACCRELLKCSVTTAEQLSPQSQQDADEAKIERKFNMDDIIAKLSTRAAAPPEPATAVDYRRSNSKLTKFGLPKLSEADVEVWVDGRRRYKCPVCPNVYANRSGLNRHYVTHSENDQWKSECAICGKKYSRKDSLKHHIKTQHHLDNEGAIRVIARCCNGGGGGGGERSIHMETTASGTSSSCGSLWMDEDRRKKKRRVEYAVINEVEQLMNDVVNVIQQGSTTNNTR